MKINRLQTSVGSLVVLLLLCISTLIRAGTLPNGFAELRLAQGLDGTTVNYAPDGRLFITQKKGIINIIKNGNLLTFLDMQSTVDNSNERGLQSMTFDPAFSTNGYIYIYYAVKGQGRNRVSRITVSGDAPVAGSEFVVVELDNLPGTIHNGGALFFKGGKLFITTGDGSNGNMAQSFSSLLGKVLRVNTDGTIPADNPYYNSLSGKYRLIYALGFRNPFRAAVQPGTERVFINDVGGSNWEEINDLIAGKNYGWPGIEGRRVAQTAPANYQDPLYAYSHAEGCSIGGGAFYNPTASVFPAKYVGKYFFGDYCGNYIKVLDPATGTVVETFGTNVNRPISFSVGNDGSFYYLARGGLAGGGQEANTQSCCSEIWRIQYTETGVPSISAEPGDLAVALGDPAVFAVGASGNAPLTYQWQRNGVNIPGANTFRYEITTTTAADNGVTFRAVITNPLGTATSRSATLLVSSNLPPAPVITAPTEGSLYIAGTVLNFVGEATDPEDGILPDSAFTWEINFHHATHTHPAMAPVKGIKSGTYELEGSHDPASDVWYRIYLTVKDAEGQSTTVFRDVFPTLSNITLAASHPGLKLKLDGHQINSPTMFTGVAGITRNIEAPSPQVVDGITFEFANWSDGGAANHDITTPSTSATLNAFYFPLLLEAESANLTGVMVQFGYTGFTGTGYGDYVADNNTAIEWTAHAPSAGQYRLDFKYANGSRGNRPLKIEVNGQVIEASKAFNPTGNWTSWAIASTTVQLNSGNNIIRASTVGLPGPNVDHLLIYPSNSTPTVATPIFTPAAGTYTQAQSVSISSATTGAAIYYTLDGSNPTTSSSIYTAPLAINNTSTIKAIAVKGGLIDSQIATAAYTINTAQETVAAPILSPVGGTYNTAQLVSITTPTLGAAIYFTTDGSNPTPTSSLYSAAINVASNVTIRAIAVKQGMLNSAITSADYIIDAGNTNKPFSVTLEAEDATLSGATVQKVSPGFTGRGYADYDGTSGTYVQWSANVPNTGKYVVSFRYANGGAHSRPLEIKVNDMVVFGSRAFPSTTSWSNWQIVKDTITLNQGVNTIRATTIGASGGNIDHIVIDGTRPTVAPPVFNPVAGNYNTTQLVTITSATAGAAIYYTTNGSTPDVTATLYTTPFNISSTTTVKAIAVKTDHNNSSIVTALYNFDPIPAAQPVISPMGGTYASTQVVSMSTATVGATIYFTTDGTTPSASSTIYSTPISISSTTTLKAIAIKSGLPGSAITTATYTINPSTNFSVLLEAENATRIGVLVQFSYQGFTGLGYGDYVNASNDYIEWTVDVPVTAAYEIGFRYGLLNGNRPLQVTVNGTIVEASLVFPVTGAWTNWSFVKRTVTLNAGVNTIRATAAGLSGPNIDHLTVANVPAGAGLSAARTSTFYEEAETSADEILSIYPIPANDIVNIASVHSVELINIIQSDGKTIKPVQIRKHENEIQIDVSTLKSGLSILNLRVGNNLIKKKIIIQ